MARINYRQNAVNFRAGNLSMGISEGVWSTDKGYFKGVINVGLALGAAAVAFFGARVYIDFQKMKRIHSTNSPKQCIDDKTESANTVSEPKMQPLSECINKEKVECKFLGATFIQPGTRSIICGEKGSNKTTLVTGLAISISSDEDLGFGLDLEGTRLPAQRTFFYDGEMSEDSWNARFSGTDYNLNNIMRISNIQFTSYKKLIDDMEKRVLDYGKDCTVIIDNNTKIVGILSADDVNRYDNGVKRIQETAQQRGFTVTVIYVMHTGKDVNKGVIGTSNWGNFAECVVRLEKLPQENGKTYRRLYFEKNRDMADDKSYIFRVDDKPLRLVYDKEENGDFRQEVTPEIEDMLLELYEQRKLQNENYGYGSLYDEMKEKYVVNSRNGVVNAINRARKRKR